jgi:hypothetical protein
MRENYPQLGVARAAVKKAHDRPELGIGHTAVAQTIQAPEFIREINAVALRGPAEADHAFKNFNSYDSSLSFEICQLCVFHELR